MTAEHREQEISPLAQKLLSLISEEELEEAERMRAYLKLGFSPVVLVRAEERFKMCCEAPEADDPNYY